MQLHCGALRLQPYCLAGKRLKYYDFDSGGGDYDYPDGYEPIADQPDAAKELCRLMQEHIRLAGSVPWQKPPLPGERTG